MSILLRGAIHSFNQLSHEEAERLRKEEKMFRFASPIKLMTYDFCYLLGTVITQSEYCSLKKIPLLNCTNDRIFLKDVVIYEDAVSVHNTASVLIESIRGWQTEPPRR